MEITPAIADSRYYRIVDTSLGPQVIFLLGILLSLQCGQGLQCTCGQGERVGV